jgi:hypothetical protein
MAAAKAAVDELPYEVTRFRNVVVLGSVSSFETIEEEEPIAFFCSDPPCMNFLQMLVGALIIP